MTGHSCAPLGSTVARRAVARAPSRSPPGSSGSGSWVCSCHGGVSHRAPWEGGRAIHCSGPDRTSTVDGLVPSGTAYRPVAGRTSSTAWCSPCRRHGTVVRRAIHITTERPVHRGSTMASKGTVGAISAAPGDASSSAARPSEGLGVSGPGSGCAPDPGQVPGLPHVQPPLGRCLCPGAIGHPRMPVYAAPQAAGSRVSMRYMASLAVMSRQRRTSRWATRAPATPQILRGCFSTPAAERVFGVSAPVPCRAPGMTGPPAAREHRPRPGP